MHARISAMCSHTIPQPPLRVAIHRSRSHPSSRLEFPCSARSPRHPRQHSVTEAEHNETSPPNLCPSEMKAPSPKDVKCKFCRRRFTARGVKEHERHHCVKNPKRRPREFLKVRCKHCLKELHGNGLRAHVAQVHPEAYARSRSVKAHRMKEKRSGSARVRKDEGRKHSRPLTSHALHSREGISAPRKEDTGTHPHNQRETRKDTTERIWEEVRKRTPLSTQKRNPSGNWRRGEQEIGINRTGMVV